MSCIFTIITDSAQFGESSLWKCDANGNNTALFPIFLESSNTVSTVTMLKWHHTHLQGLFILQRLFVGSQIPQSRCSQASVRLLDTCQLVHSLSHCLDVILNHLDALRILSLALPTQTSGHYLLCSFTQSLEQVFSTWCTLAPQCSYNIGYCSLTYLYAVEVVLEILRLYALAKNKTTIVLVDERRLTNLTLQQ